MTRTWASNSSWTTCSRTRWPTTRGELRASVTLRITDKDNTPHPGGPGAATTTEIPLDMIAPCAAGRRPPEGSTCTANTTADALAPGTVKEGRRAIWAARPRRGLRRRRRTATRTPPRATRCSRRRGSVHSIASAQPLRQNPRRSRGSAGVELAGLEPATSWVRSRRSPKLSYSPGVPPIIGSVGCG